MAENRDTPLVQRLRHAYATGASDHAGCVIGFAEFRARLAELDADIGNAGIVAGLPSPTPAGERRGGSPTLRPLDRQTLAALQQTTDPAQRCLHAGQITVQADEKLEEARLRRSRALVSAHVRHGVPMAQCYERYGILRRPFRKDVASTPAGDVPDFGSREGAFAEADRWHGEYEHQRSVAETARLVRDVEIRALTNGMYGPAQQVTNAWLAAQLGTSTARIAQIRREPERPAKAA